MEGGGGDAYDGRVLLLLVGPEEGAEPEPGLSSSVLLPEEKKLTAAVMAAAAATKARVKGGMVMVNGKGKGKGRGMAQTLLPSVRVRFSYEGPWDTDPVEGARSIMGTFTASTGILFWRHFRHSEIDKAPACVRAGQKEKFNVQRSPPHGDPSSRATGGTLE